MAEKERITNPSMGSNELGTQTNEEVSTGVSAGTDTQLHLAALSTENSDKNKNKGVDDGEIRNQVNDDELIIDNSDDEMINTEVVSDDIDDEIITDDDSEFLEADETDE